MDISSYCSEIMKQNYNSKLGKNYTSLAILSFLRNNSYCIENTAIIELTKYIYRFYSDNKEYAKESNFVLIRNIENYKPVDIIKYVESEVLNWIKLGSGVLQFDGQCVFTNIEVKDKEIDVLNNLYAMISQRYFDKIIIYDDNLDIFISDENKNSFEKYITFINNTKFRNRAFEDLDYCCCCDETKKDNLYAIHIDKDKEFDNPNNSLIMCYNHAKLYYNKYFTFDESGKIVILHNSDILDKRMHLSRIYFKNKIRFFAKGE